MLFPKRTKFKKQMRMHRAGYETRGVLPAFGNYCIVAEEPSWITSRQIESSRRAISRAIKRGGKTYINIYPNKPITKKPLEVRMGSGKGSVEFWVASVRPGRILFELDGVSSEVAMNALKLASQKLPLKVKILSKGDYLCL
jgi:large subunit ribosomal protein L16